MSVNQFFIPGQATKRDFAIYAVVARRIDNDDDWHVYVGKTGDNNQGCNPVISRAGNHFSYNNIHSQVRNKLAPAQPYEFNFSYFYVTFGPYVHGGDNRGSVDSINEMERLAIDLVKDALPATRRHRLLNPRAGTGYLSRANRDRRESLRTPESLKKIQELAETVAQSVVSRGGV